MSNKCVVVLAPNGRRQNVKVTPNTTILQILEEVCNKQGFKAEEFDIKHHNKVMDTTAIMRFSGLPNNAQLEMAAAVKTRLETKVKVGLALESGDRVVGEFQPSDSLWHVVETLCPDDIGAEADEASNVFPVIFYMGREECGTENLKKTSLRSLGLTTGGAILRFFKKTPEELHHQANVSAPLSRPSTVLRETPHNSSPSKEISAARPSPSDISGGPSTSGISKIESKSKEDPMTDSPLFKSKSQVGKFESNVPNPKISPDSLSVKEKSESEVMDMDYEDSSETSQVTTSHSSLTCSATVEDAPDEEPEETIVFLGERNAVLFDMGTARACKPEDVPDDFFDLTLDDAKQLLRDLKRRQAALEEQPLVTTQYRELERSKQMLNALNQYKRCVIRIQFPNQLVLQGTFTPLEKVSHVMQFVRGFLEDSSIDFHLFTTPPKAVLNAEQTLYDASCVPGAVVHFMSSAASSEHGSHLRKDIMDQVSSATAAASAARKSRGISHPRSTSSSAHVVGAVSQVVEPSAGSSTGHVSVSSAPLNINRQTLSDGSGGAKDKKVPKWFKP